MSAKSKWSRISALFVEQGDALGQKRSSWTASREFFLAGYATEVGGRAEILPDSGLRRPRPSALGRGEFGRPPILLLGHYDTVWPVGTIHRDAVRDVRGGTRDRPRAPST